MSAEAADLERFMRGEADAANFPHREHVRMAFEMLRPMTSRRPPGSTRGRCGS